MKKRPKLLIGIIAAIAVLAVVIISIVMTTVGGNKNTYDSHMELAQRYLDELQYEQAIAEYEAAIAIDPKNEDAYLGLAEVYVTMDDLEKALQVLAEGYEQTESAKIAARQEELERELAQGQGELSEENSNEEGQTSEEEQTVELEGNVTDEEASQMEQTVTFIPWSEAGLEDHVMDWQDENLEFVMRWTTGISDRDIMLSDVWELTELFLEGEIYNINALNELTNLTKLESRFSQISDISALSGLTNLEYLDLSVNQITDISALSGLTNLKYLRLSDNQIIDISALRNLSNLKNLELGKGELGGNRNQISDISALSGLTNLEYLDLSSNQIKDISALSGLTNLKALQLDDNQITDISALSGLTNLRVLNVRLNSIADYSPVEFIKQNDGTLRK